MIAAVVIAVVAALVCVALALALVRTQRVARDTRSQLEDARARSAQAATDLEAARGELAGARAEASAHQRALVDARAEASAHRSELAGARAEAEAARAELASASARAERPAGLPLGGASGDRDGTDALGSDEPGMTASTLGALWSLTRIRQEWSSRQVASLTLEPTLPEGSWAEVTLAEVLDEEVSRIREDTGTPGALRTSLHEEPPAGQALLLLAGVQALLEALARHCQAYDLYVHHWEQRLTAIVVCESFDGPDRVANDTEAVLSAIAPAGGELALDRDEKGRLRARLSVPLESLG